MTMHMRERFQELLAERERAGLDVSRFFGIFIVCIFENVVIGNVVI